MVINDYLMDVIWSSLLKIYGENVARTISELWKKNKIIITQSNTGSPKAIKMIKDDDVFDFAYYNPITGVLTLSETGAIIVFSLIDRNFKRVIVSRKEFCEYTKGSVLAPIVKGMTTDIRPGDEVFIVDENDNLLGVGKSIISWRDFQGLRRGEVVKLRRKIGC